MHNTYHKIHTTKSSGFTFMEVLIVMAIVTFVAAIGLYMSGSFYISTSFNSDVNTLAVSLQRARSQAINNINQSAHGVKILGGDYIIFEGDSYDTRTDDETIDGNSNFTFIGPTEVVFEQLSGDCPLCADITITDPSRFTSETIGLNTQGRIDF